MSSNKEALGTTKKFNIGKLSISEGLMAVFMTALMVVSLIPVYRLALYSTPFYDDYGYSQHIRLQIQENGFNIMSLIKGCIDCVKHEWVYEQGTYTSAVMMALVPIAWNIRQYWLGVFWIITSIVIGTFVLGWTLSKYLLDANVKQRITIGAFLTIVLTQLIYSAQQGIYWYDGAVHYTFMQGLLFLTVSAWIKTLFTSSKGKIIAWGIISAILAFLSAGVNFISTLQGMVFLVSIIIICLILKHKAWMSLIPAVVTYSVGMALNILAPGNSCRGAYYTEVKKGALESIGLSFVAAFQYLWEMTGFILIVAMLVAIPLLWNVACKRKFSYRFPGLVSLFSFCVYATGFTPGFYGMGYAGLARMFCSVKFTLLVLIFINEAYWIGWIKNKFEGKVKSELKNNVWYFLCCAVLAVVCVWTSNNQAGTCLSYGCYYYIHSGEAANYYNDFYGWVDTIENSGPDVVLEPLHWKPWFLCQKVELSTNPEMEQNKAMAWWFGKNSIRLSEE